MFIKTSVFKKLIKAAYDINALIIGNDEETIFLSNGAWIIRILKDEFPKKEKAAVIELTGDLPETGQVIRYGKGQDGQYMITGDHTWDIEERYRLCNKYAVITRLIYDTREGCTYRVAQYPESQKCFFIQDIFIDMIDIKAIVDGETLPYGPRTAGEKDSPMYWRNNHMTLAIYPISIKEENDTELNMYLRLLENMELQSCDLF